MSPQPPELCIVMPAYNEEGCIADVVKGWLGLFNLVTVGAPRLVVVNDGSRDSTGAILDELAKSEPRLTVVHQENGGHGKALLNAYRKAVELGAHHVFHVDSDDQFNVEDFPLLWEKRPFSLFILGLRAVRHDAFHRLVITRIVRLLNLVLFGRYLKDANIPYRLIDGRYLRALLEVIPPTVFAPNIFLSVLAARDGQDLMHIPVHHKDRRTGKVSIVRLKLLKACWRCVEELYAFRRDLSRNLVKLADLKKRYGITS